MPQPASASAAAKGRGRMSGPAFHIGTSGWQYDHWRGRFYPPGLPKGRWFAYYAEHFPTVEVNNTFYRQPKAATWQRWHDVAPPGFRYAIKANRFITHFKRFRDCEEPLRRLFKDAALLQAHLGPVLFQTPPDFTASAENRARLAEFLALLPDSIRHAFEFRDDSWFEEPGLTLLRRHDVAFCIQDMPGLDCPVVVTAGFAYVRFHGVGRPYAGRYTDTDLAGWANRLRELAREVDEVWVYFNNDLEANAIDNALTLTRLLDA